MDKDLIELKTRQEKLSILASEIRASGSKDPVAMLALASTLARLAQLEAEVSGKAEIRYCSEQTDVDLPF